MASSKFIALALLLTSATCVHMCACSQVNYRLPTNIRPSGYAVHLNLTADTFTENSNEFTGHEIINITSSVTTNVIRLHASHEYLRINLITLGNTDINESAYSIDNVTDILTINLPGQIAANVTYRLIIEFTGQLSTTEMTGFYKSSYVNAAGVTTYLATTQFQPTSARRAFPCFDEPLFKATFEIYLTYPLGLNALSNTAGSLFTSDSVSETMRYEVTPVMSTYLLAFIISNFTCTEGGNIDQVPYRICSREETSDIRDWALEIGPKLLASLNEFTNFNYNVSLSKLDQVAIPDFAAGAMENWGLVTYREIYLLWDPLHSSNSYKQLIATIISHEFAHFWFGNLVTCEWWSETFLNEGFANYYEYHTTHTALPEWQLDKQYVVSVTQVILRDDALENALPLQSEASSPTEVLAKFGRISYSKGGSVFRMVEHFMTPIIFRTGIRNYMTEYKYQAVLPHNLWSTLNAVINNATTKLPANSLGEVMENWVNLAGFPLLTVEKHGAHVVIKQERFLLSGSDNSSKWYVPIAYTTSVDENKFVDTVPKVWLTPYSDLEFHLPLDNISWIILNNQQTGYYRVTYDDNLWNNIRDALQKEDFDGIEEINRAQIVDDLFNLARVNKISYARVFSIVNFLTNDTSYFTWVPAINGFNFLVARVGLDSILGLAIGRHVLELMDKMYESASFKNQDDEDQIYTAKQVLALTTACRFGHQRCIGAAEAMFHIYKWNGVKPSKNLRSIVYCNGLRHSNDQSDWEFLWNEYQNATLATEQLTILSALGCSQDEEMLERLLTYSVTDNSGIRTQDALSVFSSVYNGNPIGVEVAFKFLRENHELIAEKYLSMNALPNLINGIAAVFTTEEQVEKLKEFIENGGLPQEYLPAANTALESAQANLDWLEKFEDDLYNFYFTPVGEGDGASTFGTSILFAISFALIGRWFLN